MRKLSLLSVSFVVSVLATSGAFGASTQTVVAYDGRDDNYDRVREKTFGIFPEKGRAWIEVSYDNPLPGEDNPFAEERYRLEGLSYNASTGEIVFASENGPVVCAVAHKKRRYIDIRMTGKCEIDVRFSKREIDYYYSIEKRGFLTVALTIK